MRNKLRVERRDIFQKLIILRLEEWDCHEMEVEDRLYNLSFTLFLFKHISKHVNHGHIVA